MIDRAGLDCDGEHGQTIAAGGGFFRFGIAIGPQDRGDGGSSTHANRVAPDGLREFAIDIDDAVGGVGRCGVGCPATTIIGGQRRRWRCIRLAKDDGERRNRCAGSNLCGAVTARYHDDRQDEKQENSCAFCQ